ncbi:MAG: sugar isomerase [Gilvibacter sp.]
MQLIQTLKQSRRLSGEQVFFLSGILVNAGNYLYNLALGRYLGPEKFAEAAMLVTLLLVFSFVAMTFQIVVAKFSIEFEGPNKSRFLRWGYFRALIIGIAIGALFVVFSRELSLMFNTNHQMGYVIFGCTIPIYFAMSVNRGLLQGNGSFKSLAKTYQTEMLSRLLLTFSLLIIFDLDPILAVSIGILVSICFGLLPFKTIKRPPLSAPKISKAATKKILLFFALTAVYELIQICFNNSDILLVKHYFSNIEAGLYASMALIGRVVYFVTWMFVMLLLPKVIRRNKEGQNTKGLLVTYAIQVAIIASLITAWCFVFSELTVTLLFGAEYLQIAPLLGWYALATSLFALANLFVYYFLSINYYLPVAIAAIFGALQVILLTQFHSNFLQVIVMQIIAMGGLLISVLIFLFKRSFSA